MRTTILTQLKTLNRVNLMQVLIVDDAAITRTMLERTLKKWGYEVVSVSNIDAATDLDSERFHSICPD